MTRGKAIATVIGIWGSVGAEHQVDTLVALGILKLDEPENETARLCKALGWPPGGRSHSELCIALDNAGLRIVEAES